MDRLWAPWRIEYIEMEKGDECIFCRIPSEEPTRDRENLLLFRGSKTYIILNKYPYNNGHLMVVPYRHIPGLDGLDDDEILELFKLTRISIKALSHAMKPDGYNLGINLGKAAGAGIEEHFHIHIVPRWVGDTNFMPILANTKVIVEYLYRTYDKLKSALEMILRE